MRKAIIGWMFCVIAFLGTAESGRALGTAFNYQGQLNVGGNPANGNFDMRFALYDATTNGNLIGLPLTNAAVPVVNGLFVTNLDFGLVFTGADYWLSIGVRTNGDTNAFTTLWPRQPLQPVPNAIFSINASNLLGTLVATQLSGTLPASAFAGYTNTVAFTNGANLFSGAFNGTFSGDGLNLTNLNGSAVAVGTVADARLSSNVAFLNGNQTFSGANNFTNWNNSFTGSFYGNGLVGWNATNATAFQADIDHGYVLTSSQLVSVTLPTPLHVGDIVRISGAGAGGWRIAQTSGQSIVGNFSSYVSSYWLSSGAPTETWNALACSADGSKMAATIDGGTSGSLGIYVSTDSGHTWNASGASASTFWQSIGSSADGTRLIAGQGSSSTSGHILISTNSGTTWTGVTGDTSAKWYSIAVSANGSNAVAVAFGSGIYYSINGGVNWSGPASGAPSGSNWVSVASSANGSNLVAAINGGKIYTSSNAGASWTIQNGSSSRHWFGVASSADGSKLAAVVNGGGIYTSADSGVTWTQQAGAPTVNWESIASSADGGRLAAVVNGGGIYTSVDSGVTWTRQTTAPAQNWTAICSSADGSKLEAAVSGGSIYYLSSATQGTSTSGTGGSISGAQGSAVELQYIGNSQWMPVSSAGTIWAN